MLRVLIVSNDVSSSELQKCYNLRDMTVVATVPIAEFTDKSQQQHKYDVVILDNVTANYLAQINSKLETRKHVLSKTHQGIQMLEVANICYFQAEHKYVIAYHTQGQLLIEDSLDSLEQDLSNSFIRIHRKLLVAKNKIEQLLKDSSGHYKIKLRDTEELLMVSRRKLSQVRKLLIC